MEGMGCVGCVGRGGYMLLGAHWPTTLILVALALPRVFSDLALDLVVLGFVVLALDLLVLAFEPRLVLVCDELEEGILK